MSVSNPKRLKTAITLRAAGYTLACIASKTSLSVSTLQRCFRKADITRGDLAIQTVQQARQALLNDSEYAANLKLAIATSAADDLELVKAVRTSLLTILEELEGDTNTPACVKARALSWVATALHLSQTTQRRALNQIDGQPLINQDALPTITIRKMSDDDVAAVRAAQDNSEY